MCESLENSLKLSVTSAARQVSSSFSRTIQWIRIKSDCNFSGSDVVLLNGTEELSGVFSKETNMSRSRSTTPPNSIYVGLILVRSEYVELSNR